MKYSKGNSIHKKNRHTNFDTIMGDYKFAKYLYQSEHGYSKEILIQFFIFVKPQRNFGPIMGDYKITQIMYV